MTRAAIPAPFRNLQDDENILATAPPGSQPCLRLIRPRDRRSGVKYIARCSRQPCRDLAPLVTPWEVGSRSQEISGQPRESGRGETICTQGSICWSWGSCVDLTEILTSLRMEGFQTTLKSAIAVYHKTLFTQVLLGSVSGSIAGSIIISLRGGRYLSTVMGVSLR